MLWHVSAGRFRLSGFHFVGLEGNFNEIAWKSEGKFPRDCDKAKERVVYITSSAINGTYTEEESLRRVGSYGVAVKAVEF